MRSALRLDKVLTQRVEEGCVDVRVRARTYTLYRSKGMNVRNSSGDSMHQWQLWEHEFGYIEQTDYIWSTCNT